MKQFNMLVIICSAFLVGCGSQNNQDPSFLEGYEDQATSFHDRGGSAHVHCKNGKTEIDLGSFGNNRCFHIREGVRIHEQVHVDDFNAGRLVCSGGTVTGNSFPARDRSEIKAYDAEIAYLNRALNQTPNNNSCYNIIVKGISDAKKFRKLYESSLASL